MFCCLTLAGLVAVLSLLAGPANSQSTGFAGPIAGFVYSRAWRRIQPLIGVPGSTSVGSSVAKEVDSASVAPDGGWAFITKSGSGTFVRGLSELSPTAVSVDGLIESIDRIVWSRGSSDETIAMVMFRLEDARDIHFEGRVADTPNSAAAHRFKVTFVDSKVTAQWTDAAEERRRDLLQFLAGALAAFGATIVFELLKLRFPIEQS